jgi:hypothetical protein
VCHGYNLRCSFLICIIAQCDHKTMPKIDI